MATIALKSKVCRCLITSPRGVSPLIKVPSLAEKCIAFASKRLDRRGIYDKLHTIHERETCELRDWLISHCLSNSYTSYVISSLCGLQEYQMLHVSVAYRNAHQRGVEASSIE
jgi:hypothetical protein